MKPHVNLPPPSPVDTGRQAIAWASSSGAAATIVERLRDRSRRRRRRTIAGAVAATVLLAIALLHPGRPTPTGEPPASHVARAIVSLPQRQTLGDGSLVELREGAAIAVQFTSSTRQVVLQAGEAHFAVTKDPQRPFVVSAGGVEVRAVGTAFGVEIGATAVDVVVTEGTVAVRPSNGPIDEAPLLVEAGRRILVPTDSRTALGPLRPEILSSSEQSRRLAWRVPRLEFSGTALGEVVTLLNRHGQARFDLDPALAGLQVSGSLRADDTDSLLLLLRNEFGIEAESRTDGSRYLQRR